jgi:hypothetical protein
MASTQVVDVFVKNPSRLAVRRLTEKPSIYTHNCNGIHDISAIYPCKLYTHAAFYILSRANFPIYEGGEQTASFDDMWANAYRVAISIYPRIPNQWTVLLVL